MIIECTKKLADTFKIELEDYESRSKNAFYEWHANLFTFDRRRGILLMNNKTRYCIVLYGMKLTHFKRFDEIVINAIREPFLEEGFKEEIVNNYIDNCNTISYTKTHDRSIIGQMNEFYISISWQIEDYIPSESLNLVKLNKWVGSSLMCGSLGYEYPINLLKKEMEKIMD